MNEQDLRALVREMVAQRVGAADRGPSTSGGSPPFDVRTHASHTLLRMAPAVEEGQPCIIEPDVPCVLCGFCQSLGH
jgi:hypothetical protein